MEKDKEQLEKERLQLEIQKLRAPILKNIEFWKVVIPTFAVLFSLYFTFGKGALDNQKEKLEIQKELLKLEILTFENQKKELTNSIALSKEELNTTNERIIDLRIVSDSLAREVNLYKKKLKEQAKTYNERSGRLIRDKEFYLDELAKLQRMEKGYLTRISKINGELRGSNDQIALLKLELDFYKDKISLSENDVSTLQFRKWKKKEELTKEKIASSNEEIKMIEDRMESDKGKYDTMSIEELDRLIEIRYHENK